MTWGLDLAIFSNITHYLIGKCKNHPVRKHRGHFAKMGPAYLTGIATILVLIDLTRHVINDCWGIWPSDTGTTIWYWMLVSNYTGFVLLFIGVFWGIDFHRKLRFQWRNIKKAREAKANQAREMATVQAPAQPLMSA